MVGIFDPACKLLPSWTKELYLCGWGGGVVELYSRPYSAGVFNSVSDQIQNLQNYFTTPNKNDE